MSIVPTINWKRLAPALVPDVLITATSTYVLDFHAPSSPDLRVLPGKALVAYDDLYPIRADDTGALYLDRELFVKAVNYLSQHPSPRAVAGLIYLGNSNNATLLPGGPTKAKYLIPAQQPGYVALSEVGREEDRTFQSYAGIVNGTGQTFTDTPVEIVLHNARSPLRSVVVMQDPISGHRLGDADTDFGTQFIKNYSYGEGQDQGCDAPFMSYDLTLKDGRAVKSTTIPIFHDVYGLTGFIRISIDTSRMDKKYLEYIEHFADTFKATIANDAINEVIQNSKRRN